MLRHSEMLSYSGHRQSREPHRHPRMRPPRKADLSNVIHVFGGRSRTAEMVSAFVACKCSGLQRWYDMCAIHMQRFGIELRLAHVAKATRGQAVGRQRGLSWSRSRAYPSCRSTHQVGALPGGPSTAAVAMRVNRDAVRFRLLSVVATRLVWHAMSRRRRLADWVERGASAARRSSIGSR